jgi:outer membrane protein OmpA-like peptidoglycan-associated protein
MSDAVAVRAGIPRAAGASILSAACAVVVVTLRGEIAKRHIGAGGLAELLIDAEPDAPPDHDAHVLVVAQRARRINQAFAIFAALGALALLLIAVFARRTMSPEPPELTSANLPPPRVYPLQTPLPGGADAVDAVISDASITLPVKLPLETLQFAFASATPTPGSKDTIDMLAYDLKAHPSAMVRLDGHADAVGDAAKNQKLSMARADAVKAMLVERGVASTRITTSGSGDETPVADNATEEGRAENRRVEATLVSR